MIPQMLALICTISGLVAAEDTPITLCEILGRQPCS